jgi:predicted DNA-binding antitoxin AbrB/MazE fold protein
MLTIKGTYDGKVIKPLKPIPTKKKLDVLITILDDPHNKKDTTKKYKDYYQQLTPEELNENTLLTNEFQPIDNETNHILEEQEN